MSPPIRRLALILVVPLLLFSAAIAYYYANLGFTSTDNAYIRQDKISISAEVGGIIVDVAVPRIDPLAAADHLGDTGLAALQLLDMEIQRQAAMIAYLDNFYAMTIFIFGVALLPLLLKPIFLNNRDLEGRDDN